MQRALVILVVVLLGAVALLALTVADLSSTVEETQFRDNRDARRGGPRRGVESGTDSETERLGRAEDRLQRVTEENTRLRADIRKLSIRISNLGKLLATRPENRPSTSSDAESPVRVIDNSGLAAERPRDAEGNFIVSEEDMEHFRAVQTKIDRLRRINGQTTNYGRRIDSLAERGDVATIDPENKKSIEDILRTFVTKNDDLVTRYVRKPGPAVKELSNDERREQLRLAREKYGAEAQKAIAALIGDTDAKTIGERVFTNPWGLRSRNFNR